MKREIAVTLLVSAGIGFTGCQSPGLGRLAIWNRNNAAGSTAPDVGRQKFLGLAQQFGPDHPRPMGQAQAGTAPLGGARPADNDGFIVASWKKTTAAVTGAVGAKKVMAAPEDDPLRLDKMPKKIGPEVYVGAARLLENQGNFPEAAAKYREALRATPTDLNALIGLARLHDRQGEGQKAIEVYQKAAEAHPTNGLVFNDLGLCYRRHQQLDKSLTAFRKAVDLQPENAKYRNNLAAALVDAGRGDEAFQQIAAVNSKAVAHFNVAFMLEQKGQRAEALRHLQEAIRLDPALTPAHDMLGQLTDNAAPAGAAAATSRPAPRLAQPSDNTAPYAAGAQEPSIYTSPRQVETSAAPLPPTYHLGDDAGPSAETAQRTHWATSAWALPATDKPATESTSGAHPLPPVDEEATP